MVSLLSGRAAQWATAMWERNSHFTFTYQQFTNEIKKFLISPLRGKKFQCHLLSLHQATKSVAEYSIKFRILAAESGWDEVALQSVFTHGLSEIMKDELASEG